MVQHPAARRNGRARALAQHFSFYGARLCAQHQPQPSDIHNPLIQTKACGWSIPTQPRSDATMRIADAGSKALPFELLLLSVDDVSKNFTAAAQSGHTYQLTRINP